jgi:hypothetical protein
MEEEFLGHYVASLYWLVTSEDLIVTLQLKRSTQCQLHEVGQFIVIALLKIFVLACANHKGNRGGIGQNVTLGSHETLTILAPCNHEF